MPRVAAATHTGGGGSSTPRMHHGGVPPSFSAPVYLSAPLSPRSTTPRAVAPDVPTNNADRSASATSQPPPPQATSRSNSVQAATVASANRMAIPALSFPTRVGGRAVSPPLASRRGGSPAASSRRYPSPETTRSMAGGGTTNRSRYGSPPSAATVPFREQPMHVSAATPPLPTHMLRYVQHHSGQSRDDIPELESFFTHGRSIVHTIPDVYARCMTLVNGEMWIGERSGAISRWGAHDAELLQRAERTNRSLFVTCLLPVGLHVWCGMSDGTLRILPTNDATRPIKEVKEHAGAITCMELSHNERFVFTGSLDFIVTHWNAHDGTRLQALAGHHNAVRCLRVVGIRLFSGGDDNRIIEWDVTKGAVLHTLTGHRGGVRCLQASTLYLWSGGDDATLRIWSLQGDGSSSSSVGTVAAPQPQQPMWDPAALVATVEEHGSAQASQAVMHRLHAQLVVPTCVHVITNPFTAAVTHLDVVGNKIWSVSLGTVFVWNNVTFALEAQFKEHPGTISAVHTVRQSVLSRVWSCGTEGAILLWNVESNYHSAMRASSDLHLSRLEHSLEQHFIREELLSAEALIHRTENERLTGVVADLHRELDALRGAKADAEHRAANTIAALEANLADRESDIRRLERECRALDDRMGIPVSGREKRMKLLSEQACRGTPLVDDTHPRIPKMEASFHAIQLLREELNTLHMERVLLANDKIEKRKQQRALKDDAVHRPRVRLTGDGGPAAAADEPAAASSPACAAEDGTAANSTNGVQDDPNAPPPHTEAVADEATQRASEDGGNDRSQPAPREAVRRSSDEYAVADSNELRGDIWHLYEWCGRIAEAVHGLNAAACDVLASPGERPLPPHDGGSSVAADGCPDQHAGDGDGALCIAYAGESPRVFGFLSMRELTSDERHRVFALALHCGASDDCVAALPPRTSVAKDDRDWLQALHNKYRGGGDDADGTTTPGARRLPRSLRLRHMAAVGPNAPQPSAHRPPRRPRRAMQDATAHHSSDDDAVGPGVAGGTEPQADGPPTARIDRDPEQAAATVDAGGDRVGVAGYQCALDAVCARLQHMERSVSTFASRLLSEDGSLVHHLHVREAALRRIMGVIAPKALLATTDTATSSGEPPLPQCHTGSSGADDVAVCDRESENKRTDAVKGNESDGVGEPPSRTEEDEAEAHVQPPRTVLLANEHIVRCVEAFERAIGMRAAEWKWQSEALQQLLDGYATLAADAKPIAKALEDACGTYEDGDDATSGAHDRGAACAFGSVEATTSNPLAAAHLYPSSFFSQRHSSTAPDALVQASRDACNNVFQLAKAHLQLAHRRELQHNQHDAHLQAALDKETQRRHNLESVLRSVDACARQSVALLSLPAAVDAAPPTMIERVPPADETQASPLRERESRSHESETSGTASASSTTSPEGSHADASDSPQAAAAVDDEVPQAISDTALQRVQCLATLGQQWADTAADAQQSRDALRILVEAVDATIVTALQTIKDDRTTHPPRVAAAVQSVPPEESSGSNAIEGRCDTLVRTTHALVQHMVAMERDWCTDDAALRNTLSSLKDDCLQAVSSVRHVQCGGDAPSADSGAIVATGDERAAASLLIGRTQTIAAALERERRQRRRMDAALVVTLMQWRAQLRQHHPPSRAAAAAEDDAGALLLSMPLATDDDDGDVSLECIFNASEHTANLRRAMDAVSVTVNVQVAQSSSWAAALRNHVVSWAEATIREREVLVDGTMRSLKGTELALCDAHARLHGVVGHVPPTGSGRRKSIRRHHLHQPHADGAALRGDDELCHTSRVVHDAAQRVAMLVRDATERLALHRSSEQSLLAAIHQFVVPFPDMMLHEMLTPERPQMHLDVVGGGASNASSSTQGPPTEDDDVLATIMRHMKREPRFVGCCQATRSSDINSTRGVEDSVVNLSGSMERPSAPSRRTDDDGGDAETSRSVDRPEEGPQDGASTTAVANFWKSKLQLLVQQRDVLKMWCVLLAAFARDQHATATDREAKWMRVIQRLTEGGQSHSDEALERAIEGTTTTATAACVGALRPEALTGWFTTTSVGGALGGVDTNASVAEGGRGHDDCGSTTAAHDDADRRLAVAGAGTATITTPTGRHGTAPPVPLEPLSPQRQRATSPSRLLMLSPGSKGKATASARRKHQRQRAEPHPTVDDDVWTAGLDALAAPSAQPRCDSSEDDDAGWVPPPRSVWLQLDKECMDAKQELALMLATTGMVSPSKRPPGSLVEDAPPGKRSGGDDDTGRNHLVLRQALPLLEQYRTLLHEGLQFCSENNKVHSESASISAAAGAFVESDGEGSSASAPPSSTPSTPPSEALDVEGDDAATPRHGAQKRKEMPTATTGAGHSGGDIADDTAGNTNNSDALNSDGSVSAETLLTAFDCIRRDILQVQATLTVHSNAAYHTLLQRHNALATQHVRLLEGLRGGLTMRSLPEMQPQGHTKQRRKRSSREHREGSESHMEGLSGWPQDDDEVDRDAESEEDDAVASNAGSTATAASSGTYCSSIGDATSLHNAAAAEEQATTGLSLIDLRRLRQRVETILDVDVPRAAAAAAVRIAADAAAQTVAAEDASLDRRQSLQTIRRLFGLNRRYEVALRRGIAASHEGGGEDPEAELDAAYGAADAACLDDGLPSVVPNDVGELHLEPATGHRAFTDTGRSQSFVSTAAGGSSAAGGGDHDTLDGLPVDALSVFLRRTCASAARGADRVEQLLADADAQLSHFSVQVLQACNTMAHKYTRTLDQLLHIGSITPPWRPKLSKRWQHALTGGGSAASSPAPVAGSANGGGDEEEGRPATATGDAPRRPPMSDAAETVQFHRELNQQLLKRVEIVEAHVDRHKDHLRQLPTYAAWAAMFAADVESLNVIRAHATPPECCAVHTRKQLQQQEHTSDAEVPNAPPIGDAAATDTQTQRAADDNNTCSAPVAPSPLPPQRHEGASDGASPPPQQPPAAEAAPPPPPSLRHLHTQLTQGIATTFAQLDAQWKNRFEAQNKELQALLAHCRDNLPAVVTPADASTDGTDVGAARDDDDAVSFAFGGGGPSLLQRTLSSMSASAAAARMPARRKSFAKTKSASPRRGSMYFAGGSAGGDSTTAAGGAATTRRASVSFAAEDDHAADGSALHYDAPEWSRLVAHEATLLSQLYDAVDSAKAHLDERQTAERVLSGRLEAQEKQRVDHEAHIHDLLSEIEVLQDQTSRQGAALSVLEAYKAVHDATHAAMRDAATNTDCNLLQTYEALYNDADNACRQLTTTNAQLRDSNAELWQLVQQHAVGGGSGGGLIDAEETPQTSFQEGILMHQPGVVGVAQDVEAHHHNDASGDVGPDAVRSTSVLTTVDARSEVATLRSSDIDTPPVQLPTTPRRTSSPYQLPSYMRPIQSGLQTPSPSGGRSRAAGGPAASPMTRTASGGRVSPGPRGQQPTASGRTSPKPRPAGAQRAPAQHRGTAATTTAAFRDAPQLAAASADLNSLAQQLEDIQRAMAQHRAQFRSLVFPPQEAADDRRDAEAVEAAAAGDACDDDPATPSVAELKHCMQRYDALREAHWSDFCSVTARYQGASQEVIALLLASLRRLHRVGFLVESRPPMLRAIYELYTVLLIGIRSITAFAKHTHEGRLTRREALAHVDRMADEVATATEGAAWMLANLFTDDELAHVGASPHLLPPDVRRPTWRDIALPSHYNEFLAALSVAERSVTPERAADHRQEQDVSRAGSALKSDRQTLDRGLRTFTPPKRSIVSSPTHPMSPASRRGNSPRHQHSSRERQLRQHCRRSRWLQHGGRLGRRLHSSW